VQLREGLGEFAPLEMIWCDKRHGGTDLPLRPPRCARKKKQRES